MKHSALSPGLTLPTTANKQSSRQRKWCHLEKLPNLGIHFWDSALQGCSDSISCVGKSRGVFSCQGSHQVIGLDLCQFHSTRRRSRDERHQQTKVQLHHWNICNISNKCVCVFVYCVIKCGGIGNCYYPDSTCQDQTGGDENKCVCTSATNKLCPQANKS